MELAVKQNDQTIEISEFLKSGKQTQITPEMVNTAKSISGNAFEKSQKIIEMISQLRTETSNSQIFRKRTAEQIIKDRFVIGCTDCVVVFVAAARACGLPTKYIETVDKSWLEKGGNDITGHQFAKVYDTEDKKWFWVDPTWKEVDVSSPENEGKIIYKEGLDSWDIGITNVDSMRQVLNTFRESWLKQQSG